MTEHVFKNDVLDDNDFCVPADLLDVWEGRGESPLQQPTWTNRPLLLWARETLALSEPLVRRCEVDLLSALLAEVSAGRRRIVQAGDCVEDPAEATAAHVGARAGLLDEVADVVSAGSGLPVLRAGRMAGQLAKPRSAPTEMVDGVRLPVFRGAMVNRPGGTHADRAADPVRLFSGYQMSRVVRAHLDALGRGPGEAVWLSHEALLLDYEIPLIRRTPGGGRLLASTHWPWIGERTRHPDGPHVRLLAAVDNPVACKVGPSMTPDDLTELCAVLDPDRRPGRLTLVARLGVDRVAAALPPLVRAVHAAGHPVIWMCDPMHGNTIRSPGGRKTRAVADVVREVELFQHHVLARRGVPGGLHLETTPTEVTECVRVAGEEPDGPYTTLCDPRLNRRQAVDIASAWHA